MRKRMLCLTALLLCFVLIASLAWAGRARRGGGVAATAELCSCTGDLLFCWSAESTTITSGTPAGCSIGDTSATAASAVELSATQAHTGTYSVKPTSTSDYYEVSVSTEDIAKSDAGRIEAWVYNPAGNATNYITMIRGDGTNYILFYFINNAIRLSYRGNNIEQVFGGPATVSDDGWTFVVASWSVAAVSGHYMRLGTSTDGSTPTNWVYHDTAITDMTVTPTSIRIGEVQGTAFDHYIDDLKTYGVW